MSHIADKAVLRFLLSGNTSFWSRPEVAIHIGFGTAPWHCINQCQPQYYASLQECAPDCINQTYCEPGGACSTNGWRAGKSELLRRKMLFLGNIQVNQFDNYVTMFIYVEGLLKS